MNEDVRLAGVALVCFALVAVLGVYVTRRPLTRLDIAAIRLRNRATPFAIAFTRSGYWPTLLVVNVVLAAIELALRGGIAFAIVLGGVQLLSQAGSDITKELFRRLRPDDWLYHQELGFSYPSGHATTAVVFFGSVLLFVWMEPLPYALQIGLTAAAVLVIAGIPWSRMVLAAHYATDVLGGLVFGAAWLCLLLILLRHVPVARIFL